MKEKTKKEKEVPNPKKRKLVPGCSEKFYSVAHTLRRRLREKDFDVFIAVCGYEGMGKSTLAIQLAKEIDPLFSFEDNIVIDPDINVVADKLLHDSPRYSAIIVDEAIKTMYKRGWMNKAQILLNTVCGICRKQNKAAILCMSKFADFDPFYREHRILLRFQIIARGRAVVFQPDDNPDSTDLWMTKANQKIWDKHAGRVPASERTTDLIVDSLRRYKNFSGYFAFPALESKEQKLYNSLVDAASTDFNLMQDLDSGRTKLYRDACVKAIKLLIAEPANLQQKDLAEKLGVSTSTINDLMRETKSRPIDVKAPPAPKLANHLDEPVVEAEKGERKK